MTQTPKRSSDAYKEDFTYRHNNPYEQKLEEFSHFVYRDNEAEKFNGKWNQEVFQNNFPIVAEIGSGYGEFMLEYCQNHCEINFVGIDYRFKRSYQLAKKLSELPHPNFRYLRAKGERLQFLFGENEVSEIFYFFPDPWPKTKHNKKRLFQIPFLKACHHVLKDDGIFWIKTDHDKYYEWMLEELSKQDYFTIELQTRNLHEEMPEHFLAVYKTKFEKIFLKKGTPTKVLVLRNKKNVT